MSDPSQSQPDPFNTRLEAYMDGSMSSSQRQAFEAELAGDDGLRREYELQQQIDESLGRMFIAPAPRADILALADLESADEELKQLPNRDAKESKKPRNRWQTAMVVLVAAIAWIVVGKQIYQAYQDGNDVPYRQLALAEIYQQSVESGFRPKWVCDDDQEFAGTFQERQGLPLLLPQDAQDMMVGLSYLEGLTPKTTTMLARVDDQPILVFVERLDRDTHPDHPSWWSGLNLFRQELGQLVLYEVTPLSEARVIQHFYIPNKDEISTKDTSKD